ncbi:helix-turn-helix domain-containing protein [Kitasatospora mediocidica]|uniref:helix-turn-helix domain-containing protein n=1 Tax=Kitasatospora mediocidica TaxID=58352 RepID=UPI00055B417E|nr:helix-turn-helix transcriptional regulator [Kitasatospora mediocidica]
MTLNEQYAAWLAKTMRATEGFDIDKQRGGGRMALATAVGVSPSTVARWLDAKSTPSPEYYEPIAKALGVDPIVMMVESGIISAEYLTRMQRSDVRSQPITPEQAADDLGIHDPDEREQFFRDVARRTRRHLRPAESDGETGGAVAQ